MEEFAKYILNEDDLVSKIEIIYFLAPKLGINFDKSIVFKTEVTRMFLKYTKVKVDTNLVLTASLLQWQCTVADRRRNLHRPDLPEHQSHRV